MKAHLFGILGFYGLWMLVHNIHAESFYEGSQNYFCNFPSDLDGICEAINQIHEKIDKHESTRLKSEKELLTQVSTVREQLDKESELKAKIGKWESDYKLLQDEHINIEKKLSEVQANLGQRIESLENDNKKLIDEKMNIEKTLSDQIESLENDIKLLKEEKVEIGKKLSEVKINSEDQIGSLKNTKSLLETETNKLKANLSECTDLANKLTPKTSCNRFEHPSGIHTITLPQSSSFQVLCESEVAGPGWTVIQKRFNGSLDFYQDWSNYSMGFGTLNGEFFLGLQKIHLLTNYEAHEFYANFEYFNGSIRFERCNNFMVGSEEEGFMLTVDECTGVDKSDSIAYHNGNKFSTKDRDYDKWNEGHCAIIGHGGWWYKKCAGVNPNGNYYPQEVYSNYGMYWTSTKSLKSVQMLIRPKPSKTVN